MGALVFATIFATIFAMSRKHRESLIDLGLLFFYYSPPPPTPPYHHSLPTIPVHSLPPHPPSLLSISIPFL